MSRVGRVNQSLVALLLGQALQTIGHVVVTPLFLVQWGPSTYGYWLTISAVVSYLMHLDVGLTAYVFPRLMKSYSAADFPEFDRDMHSATRAIVGLAAITVTAGGVIAGGLFASGMNGELLLTGVLLGLQTVLLLLQNLILLPYSIVNQAQRAYANAAVYTAAILAGNLLVLTLGGDPVALAATLALLTLIRVVWTYLHTSKVAPRAMPGFSAGQWSTVRMLIPHSLERSMANLAALLNQQGTLLAITASLGSAATATFSTNRTLVNLARVPSGILHNAVYVELTDLHVREDRRTAALLLRLVSAVALAFTCPVLGLLAVCGPELYGIWTRGRLPLEPLLFGLLCAEMLLLVPIQTVRTLLLATNQHQLSVRVECASVAAAILATVIAAHWLGPIAAPVSGLALHVPAMAVVVALEVERVLGGEWLRGMLVSVSLKGGLLAAVAALFGLALEAGIEAPLVRIGIGLTGALLIGALGLLGFMITGDDRKLVSERATRAFPRLGGLFARWSG